jgi:hypothetical protein
VDPYNQWNKTNGDGIEGNMNFKQWQSREMKIFDGTEGINTTFNGIEEIHLRKKGKEEGIGAGGGSCSKGDKKKIRKEGSETVATPNMNEAGLMDQPCSDQ